MSRFIESIAILDGVARRLPLHQQRVDRTLRAFAPRTTLDLHAVIENTEVPRQGLVKCRVVYGGSDVDVQCAPYFPRKTETLKLIKDDTIDYEFKSEDRAAIDHAFDQRGECDDVLIVRKNHITDTSIANIVFRRGRQWVTPGQPLLAGTMRHWLLERGLIVPMQISVSDLQSFDGFRLINALLEFDAGEYPMSNIYF